MMLVVTQAVQHQHVGALGRRIGIVLEIHVAQQLARAKDKLGEAAKALSGDSLSSTISFVSALLILLRHVPRALSMPSPQGLTQELAVLRNGVQALGSKGR